MTLNVATDFETVCDNLEAITVKLIRPGETISVTIASALRRSANRNDVLIGGININDGPALIWNIPDDLLNPAAQGRFIRSDDEIVSGSQPSDSWIVISSALQTFSSRWRCVCQKRRS